MVAGQSRRLSAMHWRLFTLLYCYRGDVVHPDRIRAALSGDPEAAGPQGTVRAHIYNLRRVLTGSRFLIQNHRSVGYELVADVALAAQDRAATKGAA